MHTIHIKPRLFPAKDSGIHTDRSWWGTTSRRTCQSGPDSTQLCPGEMPIIDLAPPLCPMWACLLINPYPFANSSVAIVCSLMELRDTSCKLSHNPTTQLASCNTCLGDNSINSYSSTKINVANNISDTVKVSSISIIWESVLRLTALVLDISPWIYHWMHFNLIKAINLCNEIIVYNLHQNFRKQAVFTHNTFVMYTLAMNSPATNQRVRNMLL